MPIWQTPSVDEQPSLIMDSWRIVEVVWSVAELAKALRCDEQSAVQWLRDHDVDLADPARPKSRHLVGYVRQNREGRLSSAILEFDPEQRIGRTSTGRTYGLTGDPDWDEDARYVFHRWMASFRIGEWRDVTDEGLGAFVKPSTLQKLH